MEWQEVYGNWVLVPPRPLAIVHFLGGAFVAAAPQVTYRALLEFLATQGFAIVATPFVNTFDHTTIAQRVMRNSNLAFDYLENRAIGRRLTIYGIGHSMGGKLHVLIGSLFPQERAGNILISFNNYPAKRSIPMLEQVTLFSPTA
jgi:predicted alpha/beta hydrolase